MLLIFDLAWRSSSVRLVSVSFPFALPFEPGTTPEPAAEPETAEERVFLGVKATCRPEAVALFFLEPEPPDSIASGVGRFLDAEEEGSLVSGGLKVKAEFEEGTGGEIAIGVFLPLLLLLLPKLAVR